MDHDERDLLDTDAAAEVLGVEPTQIPVLVDQGVLTAVEGPEPRFVRAEVEAARLMGG